MDSVSTHVGSLHTRIENAKAFLSEHPGEKIACAATIFGIAHTTLYSSIARDKRPKPDIEVKRGGNNKILDEHQTEVIHRFVRSLLAFGIDPSHGVVFNAIVSLKHAHSPERSAPTPRWFRTWWKANNLHEITTEPLEVEEFTDTHEKNIRAWFVDYRQTLRALQIKNKKSIVNFDAAGFRISSMIGRKVSAPSDISQVRT